MHQRPAAIHNADLGTGHSQTVWLGGPDDAIDARGHALTAGLTDHHLHLHAMAAADRSVQCGPPAVSSAQQLRHAVRGAQSDHTGWVRGIGYVESVAGDLTRDLIDTIDSRRPVRIQHRSGAVWMLNTPAVVVAGLETANHPAIERDAHGRATGRVWRADDWLRSRLPTGTPPDLTDVGARLTRCGLVEVTDATPDLDQTAIDSLCAAVDSGAIPQRLHLLGVPLDVPVHHPGVTVGPYKIVIADSAAPDLDGLITQISRAHASGRGVAVHCVSHTALALLLAAWSVSGAHPDDRVEHAGMVPDDARLTLCELGVTVVTQPGFIAARGDDFLRDSPAADHDDLYRCGSLISAGVPVVLSSDAPYGPLDPWLIMRAAMRRRTARGRGIGTTHEVIGADTALALYQRSAQNPSAPGRSVHDTDRRDMLVLDRPLRDVLADPGDVTVTHTVIDGRVR